MTRKLSFEIQSDAIQQLIKHLTSEAVLSEVGREVVRQTRRQIGQSKFRSRDRQMFYLSQLTFSVDKAAGQVLILIPDLSQKSRQTGMKTYLTPRLIPRDKSPAKFELERRYDPDFELMKKCLKFVLEKIKLNH